MVARKIGLCKQAGAVYAWGQSQDSARQTGRRPAARYADRHVRTGGVDQPETKPAPPRQAMHTARYPGTAARAGVDKRGCGTCPLIARHVPELF